MSTIRRGAANSVRDRLAAVPSPLSPVPFAGGAADSERALRPAIPCNVFVDDECAGPWNMALDEALGEAAAESCEAWLRFYAWSEPTLSLGYFQPYSEREQHAASRSAAVVRRASGGGAIMHHHDLTYSLAIPLAHLEKATGDALYRMVHRALIEALKPFGVNAQINETVTAKRDEPFLCFDRRSAGDVIVGSAKVAGSAQRRRQRALVQHGSILLRRSSYAPGLAGIAETSGREIPPTELLGAWMTQIAELLQLDCSMRQPNETALALARRLVDERYSNRDWTLRR